MITPARSLRRRIILVATVVVLAACSGSDDGDQAATTTTRPGDRSSTTSGTTVADDVHPCAWPTRADQTVDNIAYPDTAATYWGLGYRLAEGETLELAGTFPDARYISFISYRKTGGAVDT